MKNGYTIHDQKTAPEGSKPILDQIQDNLKFIPNALGAMAESPVALAGYMQLGALIPGTSFTDTERNLLYLTVTREYGSAYCVSAHTAFAHMDKVREEVINQVREGKPVNDKRLETLRQFAIRLVQTGCNVTDDEVQAFLDAGFTRAQILEIVLLITNKLMGVFSLRLMGVDLDEALQPLKWSKVA